MKIQAKDRRVQKFLDRHLWSPAFQWDDITDPRAKRGRRWALGELLNAAFTGMLTGCETLRDVESLTEEMGATGRQYVGRRVPDSTLWNLLAPRRRRRKEATASSCKAQTDVILPPLNPMEFRCQLRRQVRMMWRDKCLVPQGLPCGVMSFDGKGMGSLEHDAEGAAQKNHRNDGTPYWLSRMMRVSLTSAISKPILDQVPIGSKTNEVASFIPFFEEILKAYEPLFEIVTGDAGLTSKKNAERVHKANKAYVFALKDNQPELMTEAKRLLVPCLGKQPDAQTCERYNGKTVHRRLYRTSEIAGYHDWTHLQQVWLVEQVAVSSGGEMTTELRFFVTSLRSGRLTSAQILTVVRGHWGIENDCFWSLDMKWKEDKTPWCSLGNAIEILGILRIMAYNLIQLARKRSLRPRGIKRLWLKIPAWRDLLRWARDALRLSLVPEYAPAVG